MSGDTYDELLRLGNEVYDKAIEAAGMEWDRAHPTNGGGGQFDDPTWAGKKQAAEEKAQADYADIAQLAAVGQAREQMQQALVNDQIARFNFTPQLPFNKLAQYAGLIQGNYGGTTTTTAPYNRGEALLNGASAGVGLAKEIFGDNLAWPGGLLSAGLGLLSFL